MYKFIRAFPLSALLFICSAQLASANVSVDFNAPTTPQPFSFYCSPYSFGFAANHHYQPQDNGVCTYASPLPAGATQFVLYKGTVGNATIAEQDLYSGFANVVHTSPNALSAPNPNDDFFAVIYDASLGSDMNDYLTGATTTPPQNAALNVNYFVLPFKYGPKPASEFNPVLLVPDIYTSWQKDTGPVLDPIFKEYQNLIDTLKANGYVEGQTLFTLPYNWEQSNTSTEAQLQSKIQAIKTSCACGHVDVVAHGTGGFATWSYIQDPAYQKDIDQLLFLSTPFLGVPNAYQVWEGGKILTGNALQSGLLQAFVNQEAQDTGYSNAFGYVRNHPVPSISEMLPSASYQLNTPYLFSSPTPPTNPFLNGLINGFSSWQGARVTNIIANSGFSSTIAKLTVQSSTQPPLWPDGQPKTINSASGDGFVTTLGITNFYPANQTFTGTTHLALPAAAEASIFKTLTGGDATVLVNNSYTVTSLLYINLSSASGDMVIIDPSGNRVGRDFTSQTDFSEIAGAFYSGNTSPSKYAILINPQLGAYQVSIKGTSQGTFTLSENQLGAASSTGVVSGTTSNGALIGYQLNIGTTSGVVNFIPLDSNPPTITIATPQQGATYYRNSSVTPVVSIVDPEGSAIASASYKLNGVEVDPNAALPFSSALASSTFEVTAADSFGNATTTSAKFSVVQAPLTVTANNQTMTLGGAVPPLTASFSGFVNGDTASVNDLTGLASCTTTATPSSAVGSYPIVCTVGTLASNNYLFKTYVAGTISVVYRWDGFLQPINDTAHQIGQDLSVFKCGSTVPAKLQLKRADGTIATSSTAPLWLTPQKGSLMSAAIDELVYSDPASSGTTFELSGDQYRYNWSTKGLSCGYWYRIYAQLNDGKVYSVTIGLR